MAMLAERKRKQKFNLNPRGKEWSQDTNKFGQKMLEKMGWKNGKGLGANLDGIKEHIKASYKHDGKGMGYKETEQWTEHDQNFTELLKNLESTVENDQLKTSEERKPQSLEKKSASSKVRVHYHKFTRGKDLSRYSEKQLANIFGKKSLKEKEKPEEVIATDYSNEEVRHGVDTVTGGSMVDYFKKKMNGFQMSSDSGYSIANNGVLVKNTVKDEGEESESEIGKVSFGFGFNCKEEDSFSSNTAKTAEAKKNVDNSVKSDFVSYIKEDADVKEEIVVKNKKKRKSIVENDEENDLQVKKKVKVEEVTAITKKSKKKPKTTLEIVEIAAEIDSGKKTKKKKNKSEDSTYENATFEDTVENVSVVENVEDNPYEVKPKKRKSKKKSLENNPESVEITKKPKQSSEELLDTEVKQKKKKFSKNNIACENVAFDFTENSEESVVNNGETVENPYEVKTKKKKSKIVKEISENTEEIINNGEIVENPYEVKTKKKKSKIIEEISENLDDSISTKRKKKSKNEDVESGVVNPNFDDNTSQNESILEEESVQDNFEVKRKKKDKKKKSKSTESENGMDNPGLNVSVNGDDEVVEDNPVKTKKPKTKPTSIPIEPTPLPYDDIIIDDFVLNVAVLPIITPTVTPVTTSYHNNNNNNNKNNKPQRRKSVRFSDVNHQRIIPNREDTKRLEGQVNQCFDTRANELAETITDIEKKLDRCQAEVENDLNEAKEDDRMIGETGEGCENNEATVDGIRLSFKQASFSSNTPAYLRKTVGVSKAKSAYKNLIKGDILLEFANSNLDRVKGYGNATTQSLS